MAVLTAEQRYVRNMSADHRRCMDRRIGHQWDDGNWFTLPGRESCVHFRCERCTSDKYEFYDRNGFKSRSTRYVPPEGYRRPAGVGRPSHADFTLAFVLREDTKPLKGEEVLGAMWSRIKAKR